MRYKIEAYESCPCGSGSKFKFCCYKKKLELPQQDQHLSIQSRIERHMSNAQIKDCMHPKRDECAGKIIKAHSIQNNKILNKISDNGNLYMIRFEGTDKAFDFIAKTKGRKVATTFSGFCGHHDKTTFQPIEDHDFIATTEQNFLFSYRTFAFEYHKKREAFNAFRRLAKLQPQVINTEYFVKTYRGYQLAEKDHEYYKSIFDNALISGGYETLEYVNYTFKGPINVAVCSGFYLEYDLEGNKLVDLRTEVRPKILFVNVFPQENETHILLSWLKEDSSFYDNFKNQFGRLSDADKVQVLNNMIPCYCENTPINPTMWDNFSIAEVDEIVDRFHPLKDDFYKQQLLLKTGYNLLQGIVL